ncbi:MULTISPECIES: signal peptidase I [unclassified Streptomyces]|uniref:signal peptidase I n=1 Tax=unclassified Streptomyces TaxID=2593676 RepID=UPI000DC79565|nr:MULTISPECIES: signal peptidase I [unclassified Streptomyces]AWZ07548.1 signal peptidase I [Streptomyces sp. ICC4]AWZ15001.1 signal peptidase I [Streptomyces sp. ICC1]
MAVGARSGRDEGDERPDDAVERDAVERDAKDGDATDDGAVKRPHRSFWKELPLLVGIALILALLIKTFLVQAFSIPSDSMQNTLQRGDRVLVDKLTPWFGSEPERGEVVVFHDPANWLSGEATPEPNIAQKVLSFIGLMPSAEEKDLIKRTIAIGGDTVECKKGGPVVVNGKELDEPYIFPGNTPCDDVPFGPLTVPKDKIWVMGDHRQNSQDSRWHQQDETHGFVPVSDVVGRAVVVAWPVTRWSTLPIPDTFDQPGIGTQSAATALGLGASGLAPVGLGPAALGFAGAVPLVLWRRRKLTAGRTGR